MTAVIRIFECRYDGCASAVANDCLSDGNKVLQRWQFIAIAEAQLRKGGNDAITKRRTVGMPTAGRDVNRHWELTASVIA